jgi:DDE superfamily endonuclease
VRTANQPESVGLSLVGRKNCWWLAQQAGHADPGRLQRLLGAARWDADALRDVLLRLVANVVSVPNGVFVVDETDFAKKGIASVAVARQCSGTHRPGRRGVVRGARVGVDPLEYVDADNPAQRRGQGCPAVERAGAR